MLRAKAESLRGKFDDMRMKEGEDIEAYGKRVKDIVLSIKPCSGLIFEDECVRKMLRTILPKYSIRVSTIQ